jgi:aconitate hydratase
MMFSNSNPFGAQSVLKTAAGDLQMYRLDALAQRGIGDVQHLPFSVKVLLESCLRNLDEFEVRSQDVVRLANWSPTRTEAGEIPFKVGRVILQDLTGVPAVVDLAAMRSAMQRGGGDPARINPLVPVDLVIDHSVQVDDFGNPGALAVNTRREFERNRERYEFLKWGQKAFSNFRVVPPEMGIVHQVNLEYLAKVVQVRPAPGGAVAFPDTLVGTDSHTTMINGLGVVGWGVGGIEAEACMLGQPIYMLLPQVVGFRLYGKLPEGSTATDLVLVITQILRSRGVVDKFVEFFGEGLDTMSVADRATIANMAPEYGATMGFFPVDQQVLQYLRLTGRDAATVDLVERYCKEQGLWRQSAAVPRFMEVLELDMGTVLPSVAGPRRPQDRVELRALKTSFESALVDYYKKAVGEPATPRLDRWSAEGVVSSGDDEAAAATTEHLKDAPASAVAVLNGGRSVQLTHGDVAIAAITSCTNTSNPSVMVAAGLLAKKAVEKGLRMPPYVKTSLAPGSRVVTDYLARSGLDHYLDALGFHAVGYGCTTCIGNSGPLPEAVAKAVEEGDLVVASVLSGNRNFEGRINPHVKANYLASPPLVVAFALAGTININLVDEPIGIGKDGAKVYLRDLWPTQREVDQAMSAVEPGMFQQRYTGVETANELWNQIPLRGGQLYQWDTQSTYIQEPPFFRELSPAVSAIAPISGARVLVMVGDSVTTDHISPAGTIKKDSPAGKFLIGQGVTPADFNSYGARRGDYRVMTRGTFANIRLRNLLAPGTEGNWTTLLPDGQVMSIFDASLAYQQRRTPLLVLAGRDYGMGSSRDWAAKGVYLLGVRAVLAESFERIHRSNLVGMGVLPLMYRKGENRQTLGLSGRETYDIAGLDDTLKPGAELTVTATADDGTRKQFPVLCRIDTPVEIEYYRNGGILHRVLRQMMRS